MARAGILLCGKWEADRWNCGDWTHGGTVRGAWGMMPRAVIGRTLSAARVERVGDPEGPGTAGVLRMLRWLIRRREGIRLAWLLSFFQGEKVTQGDWDLDSGMWSCYSTSVGSRCLGCLARRFGDLDQAHRPIDSISKKGTLSALVQLNVSAAVINHSFLILFFPSYLNCPSFW